MNQLIFGSALLAAALFMTGAVFPDRTDAAVYEHTVRVRAEPGAAEAPPRGFEATPPQEIPEATDPDMIVDLPEPALASTKHVFQVVARFISRQKSGQSRATELIGAPVVGEDGERIGTITDLIVDENYQITAMVLSTGGVLGIGAHKVAVPRYSLDIRIAQDGPRASVPLSKADLEEAPEFQPLPAGRLVSERSRRKSWFLPDDSRSEDS
jgi:sporulation protein YlmC with PRC-barrel domain